MADSQLKQKIYDVLKNAYFKDASDFIDQGFQGAFKCLWDKWLQLRPIEGLVSLSNDVHTSMFDFSTFLHHINGRLSQAP